MSKKNKGAFVDSMPPYGVGRIVDVKANHRFQILTQDYEELRKEADAMSANLELAKQRRLVLAAEVRFLRQRYKHLMKAKDVNASQEQLLQAPGAHKQVKNSRERVLSRKEASRLRLPPLPTSKPKKKKYNDLSYCGINATRDGLVPSSVLNENGRMHIPKGANDTTVLRHSIAAFDLNQYNIPSVEATSLPSHVPIFDLNQVSTGDDDDKNLVEGVKFKEAKRSLIRGGINNEKRNELKFSICRNAGGEGPARVGKRKISWSDPMALRA